MQLSRVEFAFPSTDDYGRDAVAYKVGKGPTLAHEFIDAEQNGERLNWYIGYNRERRRERYESSAGYARGILARALDARIAAFRNEFGELGDTRLIVMAAITVVDELAAAGPRIKRLEEEIAALQSAQVATSDRNKVAQAAIASTLSAAAERVESVTKRLTQTIANSELLIGI